jgi:hypothetical protein
MTLTAISQFEIRYTQTNAGIVKIYVPSLGEPDVTLTPIIASSSYDAPTHVLTVTTTLGGAIVIIIWDTEGPGGGDGDISIPPSYYIQQSAEMLSTLWVIIALIGGIMIIDNPDNWFQTLGFAFGIAVILSIVTLLSALGF